MTIIKRSLLLIPAALATLLVLPACTTPPEPLYRRDVSVASARPLTPDAVTQDLRLAREVLETIHPGYGRYTSADVLAAGWQSLVVDADAIADNATLYVALSELLTQIRCDHTKAELPRGLQRTRIENDSFFPFRLMADNQDAYVYSAHDSSQLRRGDQIIAIDGKPIDDVIQTIHSLIPVDGMTDHVKYRQFEATGEFRGSAFEHFYPLLYGDWDEASVLVERDGKRFTITAAPVSWDDWRALPWPGSQFRPDFRDSVALEVRPGGVGVLTVDTFVNYRRPVDPETVYRPLFRRLREEGVQSLIIDTRLNGGGSDDAMIELLAFLMDEPSSLFDWKRVRTINLSAYADQIEVWDRQALTPDPAGFTRLNEDWFEVKPEADPITLQPFEPKEPRFEGDVSVLTSASNASGVALMLATLQEKNAATLIGEKTGGSAEGPTAGVLFSLKLPNSGIVIRVPWQLQRSIVAEPEFGQGVHPDILVEPTLRNRLEGIDVVLTEAIRIARERTAASE